MLDDEKNNFEMDEELFELRQKYMEMKKDRQKAEKVVMNSNKKFYFI